MDLEKFSSSFRERFEDFSREVCEERRHFLSDDSDDFLDDLWGYLQAVSSEHIESPVLQIEKGSVFYRARHHSFDALKNQYVKEPFEPKDMKPVQNIRSLGRINPYNISMLYVADDQMTAISECRADTRGEVSVGEFVTVKDLTVINLAYEFNYHAFFFAEFNLEPLYALGFCFTRPLDNDQHKGREYIVTQVLSEFFKVKCGVDGVRYLSQFSSFNSRNSDAMKTPLSTISAVTTNQANYCLFDLDSAECEKVEVWEVQHRVNIAQKIG